MGGELLAGSLPRIFNCGHGGKLGYLTTKQLGSTLAPLAHPCGCWHFTQSG